MSSKRAKIREMKRKQKQQRTMLITGCIAAAVLLVGVLTWIGLDAYNKSYIMVFEGQRVSVNDFRFCGLFAGSEETAKTDALDTLLTFMTLDKYARENDFVLGEEEKADLLSYCAGLKDYYAQSYGIDLSYITTERMAEMLGLDSLRTLLMERYTADYTVDETDYARKLADYTHDERVDYIEMDLKYIFTNTEEDMAPALEALESGADFDWAVAEYSTNYNESTGVDTYTLKTLYEYGYLDKETAESFLALAVGDISEVIDLNGMYGLFKVESVRIPDADEINTLYREKYISENKEAMFDDILLEWKQNASYTVNQRAFEAA